MDLVPAAASSALVDTSSPHIGTREAVVPNMETVHPSVSVDQGLFERLVGSLGQQEPGSSKATARAERLVPLLGTPWSVLPPQEGAVQEDFYEPIPGGCLEENAVAQDPRGLALRGGSEELATPSDPQEPMVRQGAVQEDFYEPNPGRCLEENAVAQDPRGLALRGGSEELATPSDSQEPMVRAGSRRAEIPSNPQDHGATQTRRPSGETQPVPLPKEATQVSNEPVSDSKEAFKVAGTWDNCLEPLFSRARPGSSVPNPVAQERHAFTFEGGVNSDETRDGSAEGVSLPRESCRAKAETLDANPRVLLSRMDAPRSAEEPGEQHLGELKSDGRTSPGEADVAWSGRAGASLKQEPQIDVPSRAAPPQVPSTQGVPFHQSQVTSNAAFRVFRDALHMRIHDEELGPMRWHIHMNDGRITAEAVVETTRVQELLQNHQDVLAARLNGLGVEVEDFEVFVDQGSQRFSRSFEQKGTGHVGPIAEDPLHDGSRDSALSTLQGNQNQGLDLYV